MVKVSQNDLSYPKTNFSDHFDDFFLPASVEMLREVGNDISAESSTSRHIYQLNSQSSGVRDFVLIRRRNDDEK